MTFATIVGLAAATCTTVSYLLQVVKAWRSRSTKENSINMFLLLAIGVVLWLAYGAMLGDLPSSIANFVTLCLADAILLSKLRFG